MKKLIFIAPLLFFCMTACYAISFNGNYYLDGINDGPHLIAKESHDFLGSERIENPSDVKLMHIQCNIRDANGNSLIGEYYVNAERPRFVNKTITKTLDTRMIYPELNKSNYHSLWIAARVAPGQQADEGYLTCNLTGYQ